MDGILHVYDRRYPEKGIQNDVVQFLGPSSQGFLSWLDE